MHTFLVTGSDGLLYSVSHNSDWSGMATISWAKPHRPRESIELPGSVLAACGRQEVLARVIATLEAL